MSLGLNDWGDLAPSSLSNVSVYLKKKIQLQFLISTYLQFHSDLQILFCLLLFLNSAVCQPDPSENVTLKWTLTPSPSRQRSLKQL